MPSAIAAQLEPVPNPQNQEPAMTSFHPIDPARAGGKLGAKLREQVALTTAETNACEYCLSAHSLIGKSVSTT
jgi:AhpD family alkylhydroperoxidase